MATTGNSIRGGQLRYFVHVAVGMLIVSLALRTWFIEGLVVPVTVSAGSMATTLLGPHRAATCEECDFRFACGWDRLTADRNLVCPNCGYQENAFSRSSERRGQNVWIDRTAFHFRDPRRWEVIVFRCPEKSYQYCVKRVVGLPGETIQIVSGDIVVDGQMARKDLSQCRATAQLVYDDRFRRRNPPAVTRLFDVTHNWQREKNGWSIKEQNATGSEQEFSWLTYRHLEGKPITDDYAYNQTESRQLEEVSDIGLSCKVQVSSGFENLALYVSDTREHFVLIWALSQRRVRLLRSGLPVLEEEIDSDIPGENFLLECFLFDQQLLLAVDGRVVLQYAYLRQPPGQRNKINRQEKKNSFLMGRLPQGRMAIGARKRGIQISDFRLWRDIYYHTFHSHPARWGDKNRATLRAGEFFVLGDNSPISLDSRNDRLGGVSRKSLIGKPLGVR